MQPQPTRTIIIVVINVKSEKCCSRNITVEILHLCDIDLRHTASGYWRCHLRNSIFVCHGKKCEKYSGIDSDNNF